VQVPRSDRRPGFRTISAQRLGEPDDAAAADDGDQLLGVEQLPGTATSFAILLSGAMAVPRLRRPGASAIIAARREWTPPPWYFSRGGIPHQRPILPVSKGWFCASAWASTKFLQQLYDAVQRFTFEPMRSIFLDLVVNGVQFTTLAEAQVWIAALPELPRSIKKPPKVAIESLPSPRLRDLLFALYDASVAQASAIALYARTSIDQLAKRRNRRLRKVRGFSIRLPRNCACRAQ
jgi:hypothetical protein